MRDWLLPKVFARQIFTHPEAIIVGQCGDAFNRSKDFSLRILPFCIFQDVYKLCSVESSGNADSSISLIFSAVHNCKIQFVTLWVPEMDMFILSLKTPLSGFTSVVQLFLTFGSHFVLYILALHMFSAVLWLESLPVKHQPSSFRWFSSCSNPPFS
jgi:hypothetical protein